MSEFAILLVVAFGVPAAVALIAYARGGRGSPVIPPPSPNARWVADPTRRHELRLWDGNEWTANVSDSGVSGWDPIQ